MNYIFFDVDGVLNNAKFCLSNRRPYINEDSVELLCKLAKQFNARLIISSSWKNGLNEKLKPIRKLGNCSKLLKLLKKYGCKIYAKTETVNEGDHWSRPTEIYNYVHRNLEIGDKFVILDDDDILGAAHPDVLPTLQKHFVRTSFYGDGFDLLAYKKPHRILNR